MTDHDRSPETETAPTVGEWCCLLLVLVAAVWLRVRGVAARSLWFDEALSWALANDFSWREMLDRTATDVHPPLYFAVLRLWCVGCGDSEFALRLLSVILAILTIIGVYHLALHACQSRPAGLIAAALLACNASHIQWSQEARMYTLGTLLAVTSALALLRVTTNTGGRLPWWSLHVFCCVAFLYTHNYAIFSVAGWMAFAMGHAVHSGDRRRWREAAVAYTVVLAAYSWWMPVLWNQTRQAQDMFNIADFSAWTIPEAWVELFLPSNTNGRPEGWLSVMFGLVFAALFAVWGRRWNRRGALLLVSAIAPVLGAALVSSCVVSVTLPRYLMFSFLFILCLIAGSAARIRQDGLRRCLVGVLLLGELAGHYELQSELDSPNRPGLRAAAAAIRAAQSPRSMVIILHPQIQTSGTYYFRDTVRPKLYSHKSSFWRLVGGPVFRDREFATPEDLESTSADELWTLDTSGFLQRTGRWTIPDCWQPVPQSSQSFREVYWFQCDVFLVRYRRVDGHERPNVP